MLKNPLILCFDLKSILSSLLPNSKPLINLMLYSLPPLHNSFCTKFSPLQRWINLL
ncbi:hypothetical protein Lalb_Chr10g0102901 [Lupinus albus]|uniref:Uncharacterized protein n=1 Tax=Lupinus albus TaxID=3870 RepID=A0A6A4PXE7_LUPAL|nr:hypothetical protein Lalb_Chr10g0102901 [Lupinus albus]